MKAINILSCIALLRCTVEAGGLSPIDPPHVDDTVLGTYAFEFAIPSDARMLHDGYVDAPCEGCKREYEFSFEGTIDVPLPNDLRGDVPYDMTVSIDPHEMGRHPLTYEPAIELPDGTVQVNDNINDEWTGTWITNAARCDASTGHTFLFVVNVNLQDEIAARYAFRTLMAGFRIVQ